MNEALTLTFAATVPLLCLGLLLWLARLEETLTDGIEGPQPTSEPAPGSSVTADAPGVAA
jgi:hypothetical protein